MVDGLDRLRAWTDGLESAAVGLVAKIATWAAPLPTAWLVYDRTLEHFGWPPWVAVVAGAVIEALGLAVAATGLTLWTYNRERPRKGDPVAPLWPPVVLGAVYLVSAELLIVALHVAPRWGQLGAADFAPAIFPVLTLAAVSVIALRVDHARRVAGVDAAVRGRRVGTVEREERAHRREMERMAAQAKRMRAQAALLAAQGATVPADERAEAAGERSFADFARAASGGELEPAAMTGEQVAAWAGVNARTGQPWSASTGRRWLRRWGNGRDTE